MPRMKFDRRDFNVKELDIPYDGPAFERYKGDFPRSGTILRARVTKMWMTTSKGGDQQTRVLAVAEGNNGNKAQFNGCPIWDYLTWNKENARRYGAFLACFDLTVHDVFSSMDVEQNDDNIGTPINSIADWAVGSDDALCRIVTKYDDYGEGMTKVNWDGWMEPDEDDEDEDEEPARPTRGGRGGAKSAASSRRGAATTRASRNTRAATREDDEDVDDEYEDDVEDEDEDDEYDEDEWEDAVDDDEEDTREVVRGRPTRSSRASSSSRGRQPARQGSSSRARSSKGRVRDDAESANRATRRTARTGGETRKPPF